MAERINIPTVGEVVLDWATEETLQDLLAAYKSSSGKKDVNISSANKGIAKFEKSAKKSAKAFTNVSDKARKAAFALEGMEDSAQSVTSGLLKLVGGLGPFGAALGFAAGIFDSYIDAQVSAIQSGFSFSDQLTNSRVALANIGLGFDQFAVILAEQGESLRQLGDTGADAAFNFSKLVMVVRDATESMGFYGLSSEEIANEMATLTGILIKAGNIGDELFGGAADAFTILNREVLGYSRITGQQRREIMRNRGAVDTDSMFLSAMGALGPNAVTAALNMTDSMTGTFKDAAPELIEMIKRSIITVQTGVESRTSGDIAALQRSGLGPIIMKYAREFGLVANNAEDAAALTRTFVGNLSNTLQDSEDEIFKQFVIFSSGDGHPLAEQYKIFLDAIVMSRTSAEAFRDPQTIIDAFTGRIEDSTEILLGFKNKLGVVLAQIKAGILTIAGVDHLEQIDWEEWSAKVTEMTTKFERWGEIFDEFWENFDLWSKKLFGEDGPGMWTIISGIAALWVAKKVVTALALAIGTWALGGAVTTTGKAAKIVLRKGGAIALAIAGMFTATGAASISSAFAAGIGVLFAPVTIAAFVTAALAYSGFKALKDPDLEGYSPPTKFAIGVAAFAGDFFSDALNSVNKIVNAIVPGKIFDAPTDAAWGTNLYNNAVNQLDPRWQPPETWRGRDLARQNRSARWARQADVLDQIQKDNPFGFGTQIPKDDPVGFAIDMGNEMKIGASVMGNKLFDSDYFSTFGETVKAMAEAASALPSFYPPTEKIGNEIGPPPGTSPVDPNVPRSIETSNREINVLDGRTKQLVLGTDEWVDAMEKGAHQELQQQLVDETERTNSLLKKILDNATRANRMLIDAFVSH